MGRRVFQPLSLKSSEGRGSDTVQRMETPYDHSETAERGQDEPGGAGKGQALMALWAKLESWDWTSMAMGGHEDQQRQSRAGLNKSQWASPLVCTVLQT